MKQILMTAIAAVAVLLSSCSKDDNGNGTDPTTPITGLEMPASSASNPITAGNAVTINGAGFTSASELWFRVTTKAERSDIKAKITSVTASGISFNAPELNGEYAVILKQSGSEYTLGNMSFKVPVATTTIYAMEQSNPAILYVFNETAGTFTEYDRIDDVYPLGVISDNEGNIYYAGESGGIYKYDISTKTQTTISANWLKGFSAGEGIAIGMIDNKLSGIKYNTTGYSLVNIAPNGAESIVRTFGNTSDFDQYDSFSSDNVFVYDATSNVVILTGYAAGQTNDDPALISLAVETGNLTTRIQSLNNESGAYSCLSVRNDMWLFAMLTDHTTKLSKTDITKLNSQDLTDTETVIKLNVAFENTFYSAGKNLIYGISFDSNNNDHAVVTTYDIASKTTKVITGNPHIHQFFSAAE